MPGGAAGLQNQSGNRKVPGGFDSLPSPPDKLYQFSRKHFFPKRARLRYKGRHEQ